MALVIASGAGSIAFAGHGGSHGSHCIDPAQAEEAAPHIDISDKDVAGIHHESNEVDCVEHSCVAEIALRVFVGRNERLVVQNTGPDGDLLRAFLRAENVQRPPIA